MAVVVLRTELSKKRLAELIKEETVKEEAEIADLHEQIRIQEAVIESLSGKIKEKVQSKLSLQGEILKIAEDTAAANAAADDAEARARRERDKWKEMEQEVRF